MPSSNQTDGNVFSLRIVSLDYYMSPPIHDLDLAYSTFQGRNVGEVPVIRIYGSTPAGQKACLHIHRALPYLYIPCPENALEIPEEGHKFTHILSNALEKALTHKGSSTKKRQHVHECRLVRAKKLYGYHSSDNLFVKIHLYYPHEVASAAAMLLDGAILKTSFQPYESHIPYLLQFLVDYNLYGMGHVHLSKFKFRPPVPDDCDSSLTYFQKYLIKAHGNSAAWFSSTVPSDSIWLVSSGNLIRRQSTCSLEVDASVNDILNETYKMHTSLSQTGSEVKMVQSLVPIWEEEYERSGIAVAVSSPDPRKPTPDCVLGSFNHGFEYEKALGELCADINRTFPAKVSKIEDDGNLEHSVEYFTRTSKEAVPENHSSCNILEESLKSLEEENESVQLPRKLLFQENKETAAYEKGHQSDGLKSTSEKTLYEVCRNADPKSLDTEALGLLSWLASSQGAEDVSADDELVHEALLSPLLSKKSYKEALEMAHLDYENASQQECQDILDSLEGFQGVEGSKEQVLCSTDQDFAASVSSDKVIHQVDGSVDDDFRTTTPHKGDLSEGNTNSGRNKYSVRQVGGPSSSRPCSKNKRNKPLWGPLPFAERENSEPVVFTSCHDDEPKSDSQSGYSAGHKGDRCCEGLEIYDEKGDWAHVNSVRDLMRRKRRLRTEQSDSMMQNVEMINLFPEATISCQSERVGSHIVPQDSPIVESFNADRDSVVCETVTCTRTSTHDACTKDTLQNNYSSPANRNSLVSLSSDQEMQSVPLDKHLHFPKASCGNEIVMLNASRGFMKTCNNKLSAPSLRSTYVAVENPKVNEGLEFHKREYQSFVEPLEENIDICTKNLNEQTSMHDIREKVNQNNVISESNCSLNKNDQTNKNYVSGDWSHSSLASDCGPCTDFRKREESPIYVEMSFSRKPPSREYVGEYSEDSPGTMRQAENTADINGDFLPFFTSDFEDGSYNLLNDENLIIHQQSVLGVPTHFQNDGSVLYLLTHATLPPTLEYVHQWLFEAAQDSCLNVSSGNACDKILAESSSINCVKPDISTQEGIKVAEDSQGDTKFDEGHETSLYIKENSVKNDYHDFSQISGPESGEKLGLTPLSQIGFRDAASLGGGQQLMLISIEMQAESRADLLPDPKVDAINIISLVIQEDSSHTVEVHVLLRGNSEELCVRNVDGISDCKFSIFNDERLLLDHFVKMISLLDPDILMGWEIQGGSLGFLAERAAHLGIALLKKISRIPPYETKSSTSADPELSNMLDHASVADTISEYSIIEDEWGRTHASGIHVGGRIVLNIWRLMRAELKLHMYSMEAVAEEVLRRKIPSIANRILNRWFLSGPARARYNCIQYVTERAKLNLDIMSQLDMINRTSELARVFGIDFFSVLSRGSQYRVESMLLRLAHTQNYLAISPGSQQVALQPAMECLPLVMEPESGFYADPVVVLDFQSLYPSMIIAYNLCYTTCLGTIFSSKTNILGVTSYLPDPLLLKDIRQELLLSPNGIMYVPSKVRKGVMPRLLEEILSTRIMVKQAMKKLMPSQQVLQRVFNARQLALKLIANVTYGYTAAGFSGRMPCAELADSIVQCGRRTLETAITFVNQHDKWKAQVIYGDTDSMFVLLKGRSREEAFRIGNEIASAITAINPNPVTLKMEKVYHPCFLLTKKRYVGYSYETPDQEKPIFDAKGIETVRRDTCPAVAKTLERSIRLIFEHQDISVVKTYLQRQWRRILSGKISLQDFIFSKEVRLGTYSTRASSLPPAAIVALKAMRTDPRADPKYGDRIPYIVIHGEPGARLVDMVIDPHMLLDINSPYRLNDLYYIKKQLIPALQRVLGLVGADLSQWFSELPRPIRTSLAKGHAIISCSGSLYESDGDIRSENSKKVQAKRSRIDTYYVSKHCTLCGELAQGSAYLCSRCSEKDSLVAAAVVGKTSKLEREIQRFAAVCRHCGGGDWVIERGVKCTSLACSVFYERRKVQKELQAVSSFATEAGFYPRCNAEWF